MIIINADFKKIGQNLELSVTAMAPTLGWTSVGLEALVYVTEPEDGMQQVILSGTPPSGYALQAVEIFDLTLVLPWLDWVNGVKITKSSGGHLLSLYAAAQNSEELPKEMFVGGYGVKDDKLIVPVRYGGGCKDHGFRLTWDGVIHKTFPPRIVVKLSHEDNDDQCKAIVEETLQFDLSTLDGLPQERFGVLIDGSSYGPVFTEFSAI